MMFMKIKYLVLAAGVLSATACTTNEQQIAGKDVRFIFLFDQVDAGVIKAFNTVLYTPVDTLKDALTQELPAGVASISFDVYSATDERATPFVLSLNEQDDKLTLENKAEGFLKRLAQDTARSPGTRSRYIFKTLNGILSDVDDSSYVYRIVLFSGLYENSGPPNTEMDLEESARHGTFHFVNSDNVIIAAAVDAAHKQLDDSTSWIYRNLIEKARTKPWLASVPIRLYASVEEEPKAGESGCDSRTIEEFWDKLFGEMSIQVQRKAHMDISGYRFFK
jgi:hypothetical protein